MTPLIAKVFEELNQILLICPSCEEVIYLSEARPFLLGKQLHSEIDEIRSAELKLEKAETRLNEIEESLRMIAAESGRRAAKRLLKKIDPSFSGAGYDPQDVKVIFDPVTYLVFDGMTKSKLNEVIFVAAEPRNKQSETLQKSIENVIKGGNYEFKVLQVDESGKVFST
jgi:predicted Holliday junction resolvase-like endonuclease